MKEQLISFETANLAEDKGYPFEYLGDIPLNIPTQTLLLKWLREVHNLHVEVQAPDMKDQRWYGHIRRPNKFGSIVDISEQDTYEEVLEIGLQKALELIK